MLGSLYDPLKHLSRRIHRALAHAEKTLWADEKGRLFVIGSGDQFAYLPSFEAIGIFDDRTPAQSIESALRLALRKRASNWITDWKEDPPNFNDYRIMPPTVPGKRPQRVLRKSVAKVQADVVAADTISAEKTHVLGVHPAVANFARGRAASKPRSQRSVRTANAASQAVTDFG